MYWGYYGVSSYSPIPYFPHAPFLFIVVFANTEGEKSEYLARLITAAPPQMESQEAEKYRTHMESLTKLSTSQGLVARLIAKMNERVVEFKGVVRAARNPRRYRGRLSSRRQTRDGGDPSRRSRSSGSLSGSNEPSQVTTEERVTEERVTEKNLVTEEVVEEQQRG